MLKWHKKYYQKLKRPKKYDDQKLKRLIHMMIKSLKGLRNMIISSKGLINMLKRPKKYYPKLKRPKKYDQKLKRPGKDGCHLEVKSCTERSTASNVY